MMMKKITRRWKMRAGNFIRICDMTDQHLANAIRFVERQHQLIVATAYPPSFQGEMAQFFADRDYDDLLSSSPDDLFPDYAYLVDEYERREAKRNQCSCGAKTHR